MLGGRLAEIFGTKLVFGLSQLGEDLQKLCGSLRFETVSGVALLALVTPVLAKESVWIVFVVRFLQVLIT